MQSRVRRSRSNSTTTSRFITAARLGPRPKERLVRPVRGQALAEPAAAPSAELWGVHVALDAEHGRSLGGHGRVDGSLEESWAGGGGWIRG